jgi:transposase-like protein
LKPQDFQSFVARLAELTEEQRRALAIAMSGSRSDAAAIIEARFGDDPHCPHCASRSIRPWGRSGDLKRHRCRDCGRTFTALTGTPLSGLHKRDVWLAYAEALREQASVRRAAERCSIDKTTSFRWRHRFLERPREEKAEALRDIVEVDETFFLESFKGQRKLPREARSRGGVAQKRGLSAEQIPVLTARDRSGATLDAVLPDLSDKAVADVLAPVVVKESILVSDAAGRFSRFAEKAGITHVAVKASTGERVAGVFHIQNVNAYHSRLKSWMPPFKGVATKYLPNYLGWRRMIDRADRPPSPATCLAAAVG